MNKEEILAKSREENKNADERELNIRLKAGKIAKAFGIAIAFILVFIETVFFEESAIGWTALTIAFGMNTIEDWVSFVSIKKKTDLFSVIFDTTVFIFSIVMIIKAVI